MTESAYLELLADPHFVGFLHLLHRYNARFDLVGSSIVDVIRVSMQDARAQLTPEGQRVAELVLESLMMPKVSA